MKALELLKKYKQADEEFGTADYMIKRTDEAIKELEAHIIVYQTVRNRLDNTVITLAVLRNENESLVTILEKMI